jgi:hypothetical protein
VSEPESEKQGVSKVRRNFNRTAPDFHRALAAARFPPAQFLLIQQAHEESWTRASLAKSGEPFPFKLNLSALARALDLSRPNLTGQFASLVACRVFLEAGDGTYRINKDYREWLDAQGRPRLSPRDIQWCYDAYRIWTDRAGVSSAEDRGCTELRTGGVRNSGQGVYGTPDSALQPPVQGVYGTPDTFRPPHKEERATYAREEDSKKTDTDLQKTTPPNPLKGGGGVAVARGDGCPPYPDEDTSALMVHDGAHPEDRAWAEGFWRKLWSAFASTRVNSGFYEHQRWHPRACWEAALREAVRLGVVPKTARYLETVAAGYEVNGVPAESPVKAEPRLSPYRRRMAEQRAAFEAAAEAERLANERLEATDGAG